jgi:hypothetical protein
MQLALADFPADIPLQADQVLGVSRKIWDMFGVRNLFFDIFSDKDVTRYLQFLNPKGTLNNRLFLNYVARISSSILDYRRFSSEFELYSKNISLFSRYLILLPTGETKIFTLSSIPLNSHCQDAFVYSSSQQSAIEKLSRTIRIARGGGYIGGLKARTHVFVVGVSGSGKTAAIKAAAYRESLPLFSHNLPSWIVTGARSEPTFSVLSSWLNAHPEGGVINIDEIEKIPVGKEENNHSWFTSVRAEILKLLDFDLQGFDSYFSPASQEALRKSVIVASGNFQDLYAGQISRDANLSFMADGDSRLFSEELDGLLPVTVEDLRDGKFLPEDIITRFSPLLVEVRSPTVEELSEYLFRLDIQGGVLRSDNDVMEHARRIYLSGERFRGLENYVFTLLAKRDEMYSKNLDI